MEKKKKKKKKKQTLKQNVTVLRQQIALNITVPNMKQP